MAEEVHLRFPLEEKGSHNCFRLATIQQDGVEACKPAQIGQIFVQTKAKFDQNLPIEARLK